MRVLITGGAGFIGSHTADLLLQKGYKVRILDNLSPKTHFGSWPDYLDEDIEKIKGDVRRKADWQKALDKVDAVIHLAAFMDLINDFSLFSEINTKGTSLLYEAIVKYNLPIKKVVIASSQFVYGEGRWHCPKHGEVYPKERKLNDLEKGHWDPVCPIGQEKISPLPNLEIHQNPQNAYSISKYTQELIGLRLGKLYDIPSVALRYSIVHGPRQSVKNFYSGALRIFAIQLLSERQPIVYEDGKQLRDYVSVFDVARANVLVLEDKRADFEVFNVGGGKGYSVLDLCNLIVNKFGKRFQPLIRNEFRLGDIRHAVSDIEKLTKLGWEPKVSEEEAISEYIDWLKKQEVESGILEEQEKSLREMGILRRALS